MFLNEEEIRKRQESLEVGKGQEEKERHFALWAGVLFFMILIVFLWFLNTKNLFDNFSHRDKGFNIDQFTAEFKALVSELDGKMGELKEVGADLRGTGATGTPSGIAPVPAGAVINLRDYK